MATYSGISIAERDKYRDIFASLGPVDGVVTGLQCRSVFLKSGLDNSQLEKIWNLADMDHDGSLDIEEFIVAMRIIYDSINGAPIPPVLPGYMIPPIKLAARKLNPNLDPLAMAAGVPGIPTLASTANPGMGMMGTDPTGMMGGMGMGASMYDPMYQNQLAGQVLRGPTIEFTDDFDWYMQPAAKLKYEMEFERAPTKNGLLSKAHAYEAFALSRRPVDEFEIIWSIVDLLGKDEINVDQYVAFQHIINARKGNKPFPRQLPPEVIATFRTTATPVSSRSAGMSRSVSKEADLSRSSSNQSLTAGDDAKVSALEQELAFLQGELDKLGSGAEKPPSLIDEYSDLKTKLQGMIDWMNENLPLLPSDNSAVDLGVMLKSLNEQLVTAQTTLQREKSTAI
ncbi:endocytosis defective- protein [Allomyces arbusculus]|nr:endocytosis defective- protein [Allomyces arbusculus]